MSPHCFDFILGQIKLTRGWGGSRGWTWKVNEYLLFSYPFSVCDRFKEAVCLMFLYLHFGLLSCWATSLKLLFSLQLRKSFYCWQSRDVGEGWNFRNLPPGEEDLIAHCFNLSPTHVRVKLNVQLWFDKLRRWNVVLIENSICFRMRQEIDEFSQSMGNCELRVALLWLQRPDDNVINPLDYKQA